VSAIAGHVNFHNLHNKISLKPKKISVTEKIDFKEYTVMDFTACSLPPLAFTFDLLPKSDDIVLFYFISPRVQITFYFPPPPPDHFLCTSPTYQVALVPFHQKRCYWPYLCFYHTSPSVFRTFSLPPSATETTFTLPQFGQSGLF
jgi:hypothetical protein